MKNWRLRFLKELLRRCYSRKDIRQLMKDIGPFFEYLSRVNKFGLRGIEPEHVRSYIAAVKTACIDTDNYNAVFAVNEKVCAVKMFCLQMFIAGKLPHDYSGSIGFMEMPQRKNCAGSLSNSI